MNRAAAEAVERFGWTTVYSRCARKARYVDRQQAEARMRKDAQKRGPHGTAHLLKPFPCRYCNGWHIGREWPHEQELT